MLHATTVESVHCTRNVQKGLGVRGHDLLKLLLGSYSCCGRAILYSPISHPSIPPYALPEWWKSLSWLIMSRRNFCMFHPPMVQNYCWLSFLSLLASIFCFAPWLNWTLFYRIRLKMTPFTTEFEFARRQPSSLFFTFYRTKAIR